MAGCPGDILRLPAVIISTGHLDTPPHLDSPTEMQVRRFVPHFSLLLLLIPLFTVQFIEMSQEMF